MDLTGILAITGKPGLYKLISQTKSGALVESLVDKKRMPAFAHERISSLKDITMFGNDEDKPFHCVLHACGGSPFKLRGSYSRRKSFQ